MAITRGVDPTRGYNFKVSFADRSLTIAFKKVSGLRIGVNKVGYREGTDSNTLRQLPGLADFDDLVFERGVADNVGAMTWMQQMVDLNNEAQLPSDSEFRSEVLIQVLNRRKEIVREYAATASWPTEITLGDLDAEDDSVLVETLTLAHEGLKMTTTTDIAATQ